MTKYSDYTDVFSFNLIIKLLRNTNINKYAIELIKEKQLLYKSLYILSLVELEILKIYIETHERETLYNYLSLCKSWSISQVLVAY